MAKLNGAVACGHAATADAAINVLQAGGNAVDAAIAAFWTACAAEPVLCSPGGGGFAMVSMGNNKPKLLDFFAQTPRQFSNASHIDFEAIEVDFGSATQVFHIGMGTIAAPGAVAGIYELHRQFGRVPMLELVQPALGLMRGGAALSAQQAHVFSLVEPIYVSRASSRAVFESLERPGHIAGEGEVPRFTELADFVDVLAREGEDFFYRGEFSGLAENHSRQLGGHIRRDDLTAYEALWREPLLCNYRGNRVWLNPPPSAGGVLINFALELLATDRLPSDEGEFFTELANVMALTNEGRLRATADGSAWPSLEKLFDPEGMAEALEDLANRRRAWRGTTHLSVADANGGLIGLTLTNGEGCGEVLPGTGVMLNNMLGEEDVNPAGKENWGLNQRLSSMMAPTLLELDDGPRFMIGSGGSNRIRSAILQVIIQLADFNPDLQQAVDFPRIHLEGDVLNLEGGIGDNTVERLVQLFGDYNRFESRNFFFGGVHGVAVGKNGLSGAGDSRRAGVFKTG